jgi:autotransporter-associated beta strand protein
MGNSTYSGGTSTPRMQDGMNLAIGHNNALGTGPLTLGYRVNVYAFARSVTIPNDVYWNGNDNGNQGEFNIGAGIASANDLTVAGTSYFIGNDNRLAVMRNEGKTTLAGPVIYASNVRFEWDNVGKADAYMTGDVTLTGGDRTITVGEFARNWSNTMVISGTVKEDVLGRALTKLGHFPLVLSGTNTYTGKTQIDNSAIQAIDGTGLPTNSQLFFNGGVLESNGTFQRTVQNVAGNRVFWNGDGGFAAVDGKLTVTLNTAGSIVDWSAATGFNNKTLILSSKKGNLVYMSNANSEVEITNPINLVNAARTVKVDDNGYSAGDFATLSGIISSTGTTGGITKTGAGTLYLSNTGNTYTGPTLIQGGAVRVTANQTSLPAASLLTLQGGVLESSGTFTRSIGTAPGNVQWTGAGGFSAKGGALAVTLNNDAVTVIDWAAATASGGLNGQNLRFGSATSDNVVTLVNHLNMNTSGTRTITVNGDYGDRTIPNNGKYLESLAAGEYAEISGIISNSHGSAGTAILAKAGAGTLLLSGMNTYTGPTLIQGGALRAADGTGLPTASPLQFNHNTTVGTGGSATRTAVLETSGTFDRAIGTGADQVEWIAAGNGGGFAANGGALTVNFNGGTGAIDWAANTASGGLNSRPLIFGSFTANNVTTVANPLNLKGDQTIYIVDNPHSTADFAQLDGAIANGEATARGLTIRGNGLLVLNGSLSFTSHLNPENTVVVRVPTVAGLHTGRIGLAQEGVLETSGTFTRALGTSAGQISFGGGGFSAFGAKLTVNLHNDQRELVWQAGSAAGLSYGTTNFYTDIQIMTFGSVYSNNEVEWQNPLALGVIHSDKVREIKVNDNPLSNADFTTMSGVIRDANSLVGVGTNNGPGTATNNGIRKTGTGVLKLSAANTYTGTTLVDAGTLVAANGTALGTIASGTTVATGATLDVRANIGSEAISVGGTGVGGAGALITADTFTGMVGGTVTLTGATSIGGAGTGILNIDGIVAAGANTLTTLGTGETTFGAASTLTSVASLAVTDGTTNVNSALGTAGNTAVTVSDLGNGTKLRFGSVSQTLSSLTIGAGATVIFTSGLASGSFGDDGGGKAAGFGSPASSFGGGATVPEPGTLGLLLVGALGMLNRRRRQA